MSVEDNSKLHYINDFLSAPEKQGIPQDIEVSLQDIHDAVSHLEQCIANGQEVPNKVIGRCVRVIKVHQSLKYGFDVSVFFFSWFIYVVLCCVTLCVFVLTFCFVIETYSIAYYSCIVTSISVRRPGVH